MTQQDSLVYEPTADGWPELSLTRTQDATTVALRAPPAPALWFGIGVGVGALATCVLVAKTRSGRRR